MKSVQALHADIEWRRMRDSETYYPLRDGPRLYRGNWVIETMARYLPDDHVALAKRLASMHARTHKADSRSESMERVQGGIGQAALHARMARLSAEIKTLTGFGAAALRVGRDGYGCFRGICVGDSQAELCRRVGYPESSRRSIRKLVQMTMIELSDFDAQLTSAPNCAMTL